jgi:putative endonuclease
MTKKIFPVNTDNKQLESKSLPSKWFVYAILCSNDSVYIGQTIDLAARFELHKKGKGARWTKKYPPVRMFYFEEADSHFEAATRERELKKSKGRKMLKDILKNGEGQQCLCPAPAQTAKKKKLPLTS